MTRLFPGAKFSIGSSGLLGDTLIEIKAPAERNGEFIPSGAIIEGEASSGLGALASSAEDLSTKGQLVLEDIRAAMKNIGSAVEKVDEKMLADENLKKFDTAMAELSTAMEALNSKVFSEDNSTSLSEMLANLKQASAKLDEASDKVGPILENGDVAIAALKPGIERLAAAAAGVEVAVDKINNGAGLLASLLGDSKLKQDMQIFAANLRRSGILRYKDSAAAPKPASGSSTPRRKGFFGGR